MTPADPLDPVEALRRIAEGVEHWDAERDADSISVLWRIGDLARAALAALPAPVPEGVPEDRLVPDGWRVEWLVEEPEGPGCGPRRTPYLDEIPMAADTPHEEGEQP